MRLEPHPLIVFELDDSRVHLSHRQVFNVAAWCTAVFAGNLVWTRAGKVYTSVVSHVCALAFSLSFVWTKPPPPLSFSLLPALSLSGKKT